MAQFVFTLFGAFNVLANGESVTGFRTDKERALLTYLALEAERPVSRSTLVNLFWSEMSETRARDNLRKTLHRLRTTLDAAMPDTAIPPSEQLLTITRQTIQFNHTNAFVDVQAFQTLLAASNTHDHEALQLCAACLAQLEEATTLYQGELLAGFSIADAPFFEEWLLLRRELVQQQALLIHNLLATAHESAGNYQRAHAVANRLLALDPYREEGYHLVMRLLTQMGQPHQALRLLEQMRQLFRTELDVEPSTEILALARAIAAGEFDKGTGREEEKRTRREDHVLSEVEGGKPSSLHPVIPSSSHLVPTSLDLHEVPDPGPFFGRADERRQIANWLLHDRCRLVAILGIGGLGKTTLAAQCVRELAGDANRANFDVIVWRSLLNAPPLAELLPPLLQILSDQQLADIPESLDEQLRFLLGYLRDKRVLLVLDNMESILEAEKAGAFRVGYEPYGQLIQQIATYDHQSHLLLTSRERPRDYARLEGDSQLVQTLQLGGLDDDAGHALLAQRGLHGVETEESMLIARYSGNPLALKLAADTVEEIFGGDLNEFLQDESIIFDDIRTVLDQHFARLAELEQQILFWLAVEREPTALPSLRQGLLQPPKQRDFLEALGSLQRRALVERQGSNFALQNVVTEYLTARLVDAVCQEIESSAINLLRHQALVKANAKEYIRESQERLILEPICVQLVSRFGDVRVTEKLHRLLIMVREQSVGVLDYAGGNILNLLLHLKNDLRGLDFSQLALRQVYLKGASLTDTNFTEVNFADAVFTDSFGRMSWVTVSPDDQLMAAGFDGGKIGLWRLPDVQPVDVLVGHKGMVRWVMFSPDGQRLVSAGGDNTVRLWEVATGNCLKTLRGHQKSLHTAVFSPDGRWLASGGQDNVIHLWDAATGQLLTAFTGHTDWINAVAFHPNGELLASASHDNTICLWDLRAVGQPEPAQTDPLAGVLEGHTYSVAAVAFSPDGTLLASGSGDYTVRLWDVASRRAVHTFAGHTEWVRGVAFSPDGSILASGGADQLVRLWHVSTGQSVEMLRGHAGTICALTFTSDGRTLVSADSDSIRLWGLDDAWRGQTIRTLRGNVTPIHSVAFNPDGMHLASGDGKGTVRIWDVGGVADATDATDAGTCCRVLTGHTQAVIGVAFHRAGALLASASHDGTIRLWEVSSGICLDVLQHAENNRVNCFAFAPTGAMLASAGVGGIIYLWQISEHGTGHLADTLTVDARAIQSLAFHDDGNVLAHGTTDHAIYVWDLVHKQRIHHFEGYPQEFWSLCFISPDEVTVDEATSDEASQSQLLVGGGRDGVIRFWDLHAQFPGKPIRTITAHRTVMVDIAFSPATGYLASCGGDCVQLWDSHSGESIHRLDGHEQGIESADFRFDGQILASGSKDGTINLWDVQTGQRLQTLRTPGPYEGMNISGVTGISAAQRAALKALGAVETPTSPP